MWRERIRQKKQHKKMDTTLILAHFVRDNWIVHSCFNFSFYKFCYCFWSFFLKCDQDKITILFVNLNYRRQEVFHVNENKLKSKFDVSQHNLILSIFIWNRNFIFLNPKLSKSKCCKRAAAAEREVLTLQERLEGFRIESNSAEVESVDSVNDKVVLTKGVFLPPNLLFPS